MKNIVRYISYPRSLVDTLIAITFFLSNIACFFSQIFQAALGKYFTRIIFNFYTRLLLFNNYCRFELQAFSLFFRLSVFFCTVRLIVRLSIFVLLICPLLCSLRLGSVSKGKTCRFYFLSME